MANVEQYVDSGVAVITLNDGQRGNLLGPESLGELAAAVDRSQSDPAVRAVLLRSNGPSFCLGMDLGKVAQAEMDGAASAAVSAYADLLNGIFSSPLPFLCVLQGDVKAGGVGLACACDIVLATPQATFEMAEVLFGIIPANVLPYLLALRVPLQKARYLVMTSRTLDAAEALRLNLIDELAAEAEIEKRVREILKRLLRSRPAALAEVKVFTALLHGKEPREAGLLARQKLLDMLKDAAVGAGIAAYQEGGLPSWSSQFRPKASLARPGAPKGGTP